MEKKDRLAAIPPVARRQRRPPRDLAPVRQRRRREFDFLGYTFGRMFSARTGQARIGYRRRRGKSLRAIAAAMAKRGHKLSVEGVRKVLRAAEERMASPRRLSAGRRLRTEGKESR